MVEVTEEDRLAAQRWGTGPIYNMEHLAQAFARHRIAAENAALERAAQVADGYKERMAAIVMQTEGDCGEAADACWHSDIIAKAIRAMKGPSNAD